MLVKFELSCGCPTSMPLTRHLYREDEVASALIYCILRSRHVESAFWCLELLDSGLVDELLKAARLAWFYGVGIRGLGWLRTFQGIAAADAVDADVILRLIGGLCRCGKDRSIVSLLASDVSEQPDRVNVGSPIALQGLEAFVAMAILQRKTLTAWGGLRGLADPDAILRAAAEHKHGAGGLECLALLDQEPLEPWERRAAATAALCLSPEEFRASWEQEAAPPLLVEVDRGLEEWRGNLGRRARREYPIPPDSLYWFTERGRKLSVYDTNEKEIIGRLEKPGAIWESSFWDDAAEEFGGWEAVRDDAESREAFYDRHFPDDKPDEWSKAERAKSHGAGPLQRGGVAELSRAMDRLIGRLPSAVIWGPLPPVKKWDSVGPIDVSGWNLTPVSQRKLDPL